MIQLQRDCGRIPENSLFPDMHKLDPKSLGIGAVGRQCYCQIPGGGT